MDSSNDSSISNFIIIIAIILILYLLFKHEKKETPKIIVEKEEDLAPYCGSNLPKCDSYNKYSSINAPLGAMIDKRLGRWSKCLESCENGKSVEIYAKDYLKY